MAVWVLLSFSIVLVSVLVQPVRVHLAVARPVEYVVGWTVTV